MSEASPAITARDEALDIALDECPVEEVLSFLMGNFVGLVVEVCRRNGGADENCEIKIEGGANRDVTIGPRKSAIARATGKGE